MFAQRSKFVLNYFRDSALKPSEKGLQLAQTNEDNQCILTINTSIAVPGISIEAVDVLCNARHVEVLSLELNEYVETLPGVRVDEELGCERKVFMLQKPFESPVNGCKFRVHVIRVFGYLAFYV